MTKPVFTPRPKTPKINNTDLLKQTGLRIRHFHGTDRFGYPRMREMTVAYIEKRGRLEIATAVVHSQDRFCRKMGTKQAIENFLAGKTVTVPAAQDLYADKPMKAAHPNITLMQMFN